MKKINSILKTTLLALCVLYTGTSLALKLINEAWAIDSWEVESIVDDAVSDKLSRSEVESIVNNKISSYDYDFKRAVRRVVENDCTVDDDSISCY